jgi:hypothetical protein
MTAIEETLGFPFSGPFRPPTALAATAISLAAVVQGIRQAGSNLQDPDVLPVPEPNVGGELRIGEPPTAPLPAPPPTPPPGDPPSSPPGPPSPPPIP